jgi:hypothetical protein
MRFKVVFEPSDEGGFTAYVPALPGCISEGDSVDEALANHPRGHRTLSRANERWQYRKTHFCHPERVRPVNCVAASIQRRVSSRQGDSSLDFRRYESLGADPLRMTGGG